MVIKWFTCFSLSIFKANFNQTCPQGFSRQFRFRFQPLIMDFQVIVSQKSKPIIIYNNFTYRKAYAGKDYVRWRCTKNNCSGIIRTDTAIKTILSEGQHDHSRLEEFVIKKKEISVSCKRKAADDVHAQPRKIVRTVLGSVENNELTYEDVQNVKQQIYRTKRKFLPPIPKNLLDCYNYVTENNLDPKSGEQFVFLKYGIILITWTLNIFFGDICDCFVADGTFSYAPRFFAQMYTVHGYKNGYYIPVFHVFLENKTQLVYENMWKLYTEVRATVTTYPFYPRKILIDFEFAMLQAIKKIFPWVQVQGCRFHFAQSLYRKIHSVPLLRRSYQDPNVNKEVCQWLHCFFGLPFLSAAEIPIAVAELMAECPNYPECHQFGLYVQYTYVYTDR